MQEAKRRWGYADVHHGDSGASLRASGNRAPAGGPVHQALLTKREQKLARRAARHQKQLSA